MSEITIQKIKKSHFIDKNISIGIDLGTSYSCAGIWYNNKVEIIPNQFGYRTTPSMICFQENQTLIGNSAKFAASKYPYLTIFDAKRLIGRKFSEEEVQNDIKTFPFKVTKDDKDNPIIEIEINNKIKKTFTPTDISAILLKQIKIDIEEYLGREIKDAVITVPAFFNDLQREETRNAAKIAGLNVLRIIKEPIAAALAYNLSNENNKNILIFDLGGGTFDVSILKVDKNVLKVISTKGDNHLGGNDFDNKLVDFCVGIFKDKYNVDLQINNNDDIKEINKKKKALYRLKIACEKAKIDLSRMEHTSINIDRLYDKYDFETNISRSDFEFVCADLFIKCFNYIDEVLSETNIDKNKIDEIILIGGSTKIPKIREMVKEYFNKEPNKSINPDETVAYGAVIQGSIILNTNKKGKNMILLDKNPFPFGVANIEGKMVDLIKEGSDIPISITKDFYTPYDDATSVRISIYEGPYEDVIDNYKIGEFDLVNLPKKKKGEVEIKVTFYIDVNNILHVSAKYLEGNISKEILIVNDRNICFTESIKKIDKLFVENIENIENYKGEIIKYEKEFNISKKLSDLQKLIAALENFINTFENNINYNKTMIKKYNHYINALFRKYNYSNEINGHDEEIMKKIIKHFKLLLKYELDIKECLNIFNKNLDIKFCLLIEYMQFYLDNGIIYEKKNENKQAIKLFNEGLDFCYLQNNLYEEIKKIKSNYKDKFIKIYGLLVFKLKRNQAKILYDIGEKYLKKGDETNNIEEYINAIDNYRKAYSILKDKFSENTSIKNSFCENFKLLENINIRSSIGSYNSYFLSKEFTGEDEEEDNKIDYELEANIIFKIVYITYEKFNNTTNLSGLKERLLICKDYIKKINGNNKNDLYQKVENLINKIENEIIIIDENDRDSNELMKKMKKKYPRIFKELEEMESKSNEDYIKFILKRYPYTKYIDQNDSIDVDKGLRENQIELIEQLFTNYFPDVYPRETEEQKKYYCIVSKIDAHLSSIKSELETRQNSKKKKKKK